MKLSEFAKRVGITTRVAYDMFHRGELNAFQLNSGTIIVDIQEGEPLSKGFKKLKKNEIDFKTKNV